MDLEEVRNQARVRMKGFCGVYKECDGDPSRLCQGHSYGGLGIGGVGSGASFTNNVKALKNLRLRMRLVDEAAEPDTSFDFFGHRLSMPVFGAPVTGVNSFGGDAVITEKDFCHATVLGCRDAGTVGWRGDTYTYDYSKPETCHCLSAFRSAGGTGVKIIKPREQEVILREVKRYEELGIFAFGVDIDGCGSVMMNKHGKPVFKKSMKDLKEIASAIRLPFVVKGVMTAEDAVLCVEAGARCVVVSNHGGRVLDHTPGTAEVLPEIAASVGDRAMIIADGGVRNGFDVLKMLALGANAVLVGRDIVRAAVGGGADGVKLQMDMLRDTLSKAMMMTGCGTLGDITGDILE